MPARSGAIRHALQIQAEFRYRDINHMYFKAEASRPIHLPKSNIASKCGLNRKADASFDSILDKHLELPIRGLVAVTAGAEEVLAGFFGQI
jgi:hypothetical protein